MQDCWENLVSLSFTSWSQMAGWLRLLDGFPGGVTAR